jgi:hypothetical protein
MTGTDSHTMGATKIVTSNVVGLILGSNQRQFVEMEFGGAKKSVMTAIPFLGMDAAQHAAWSQDIPALALGRTGNVEGSETVARQDAEVECGQWDHSESVMTGTPSPETDAIRVVKLSAAGYARGETRVPQMLAFPMRLQSVGTDSGRQEKSVTMAIKMVAMAAL